MTFVSLTIISTIHVHISSWQRETLPPLNTTASSRPALGNLCATFSTNLPTPGPSRKRWTLLCLSSLLHWAWLSRSFHVASDRHSNSRRNSACHRHHTTLCVPRHRLMDVWVVPTFRRLWTVVYTEALLSLPLGAYLGVTPRGHVVTLRLRF